MTVALIEELAAQPARKPKPISPKRLAANRKNAKKSTGPRTSKGKQTSSQNSLKHGLCSQSPLLPNECGATYEIFKQEIYQDLHPTTCLQKALFSQAASLLWKLQRIQDTERELFRLESQAQNTDLPCQTLAQAFQTNPTSNSFVHFARYERQLRNSFLRLIKEIRTLQKDDPKPREDKWDWWPDID